MKRYVLDTYPFPEAEQDLVPQDGSRVEGSN